MSNEIWDGDTFRGFKPSAQALGRAEDLIHTANISPEVQNYLLGRLMENTAEQLTELIALLEQMQKEPEDPAKQFIQRSKIM